MLRHRQAEVRMLVPCRVSDEPIPGRSLVPAAQAQPGAASTQLAVVISIDCFTNEEN